MFEFIRRNRDEHREPCFLVGDLDQRKLLSPAESQILGFTLHEAPLNLRPTAQFEVHEIWNWVELLEPGPWKQESP